MFFPSLFSQINKVCGTFIHYDWFNQPHLEGGCDTKYTNESDQISRSAAEQSAEKQYYRKNVTYSKSHLVNHICMLQSATVNV